MKLGKKTACSKKADETKQSRLHLDWRTTKTPGK